MFTSRIKANCWFVWTAVIEQWEKKSFFFMSRGEFRFVFCLFYDYLRKLCTQVNDNEEQNSVLFGNFWPFVWTYVVSRAWLACSTQKHQDSLSERLNFTSKCQVTGFSEILTFSTLTLGLLVPPLNCSKNVTGFC